MGYFASGFAFGSAPNWQRLEELLTGFWVRGYRHKTATVLMLDAYRPRTDGREHFPFTAGPITAKDVAASEVPARPAVVQAFDAVGERLRESAGGDYETHWLDVPLLIASAAGTPTFAFTADDEAFDRAAFVASGAIVRARCRLDVFDVCLEDDTVTVVPYAVEGDDYTAGDDLQGTFEHLPNVRVGKPKLLEGGFRIFDHPSTLWPKEWGDAGELLGFGTFDAFESFDEDFELVFESRPTAKPWWKVWR
jgi:hypothetical protein